MKKIILIFTLLLASFSVSASSIRGDLNNDGKANISDVTFLINRLLSGETQWTQDVTGDGQVNISDVTALINYLLSGEWPWTDYIGPAPDNAVTYTVNGYQFVMVPVEGGTFMMGYDAQQYEHAYPVHQVTLSGYSIGMTEVTMGLWKAVTGSYPPYFHTVYDTDNTPVWFCSWDHAREFIAQLNELTGLTFRLPTEAQWEFAARGGNLSQGYRYSGSDDIEEVGWYSGNSPEGFASAVGLKAPNELGLYDMSGNVSEFCEDDYLSYGSEPQVDPLIISNFSHAAIKVARGGSCGKQATYCTVTTRQNCVSYHGDDAGGFRLAL